MAARIPAPERGSYEWRQRDRMLSRYLSVRGAEEGTPEAREARRLEDRLVRGYAGLVGRAVGERQRKIPENLAALARGGDLRTVGMLGILRALRTFGPGGRASFASYAYNAVRWTMLSEIQKLDGMSGTVRRRVSAAIRATRALEDRTGRFPSDEEAAAEAGITAGRYRKLIGFHLRVGYVEPLSSLEEGLEPEEPEPEKSYALALGRVHLHQQAQWLLRYAGRKAACEVAALYCAGHWGDVSQPQAWRNDLSVERGAGRVFGLYELPEVGGARVLISTNLDDKRSGTSVEVDSVPEWVRDLMDGTGTERRRAA